MGHPDVGLRHNPAYNMHGGSQIGIRATEEARIASTPACLPAPPGAIIKEEPKAQEEAISGISGNFG